jgi:hypothetical protein
MRLMELSLARHLEGFEWGRPPLARVAMAGAFSSDSRLGKLGGVEKIQVRDQVEFFAR